MKSYIDENNFKISFWMKMEQQYLTIKLLQKK